jgi:TolB-like protein
VLTFENVTRDTSAQYLAEGLADQIATRLGAVERLTIISRSAVRRLRDPSQQSIQQVGRTLNAAYLVSGAMRAAGGRVRVNVEAVRVSTAEAIWSEAYDRASDSLIGLEETIATEVAAGVAGRLTPQERRDLASRVTTNSRAYEQYLRGNVLLAERSPSSIRGAIAAYQRAVEADPRLVDAHARLGYAYAMCAWWQCGGNVDTLQSNARQQTARALHLDPGSSNAWLSRGWLLVVEYQGTRSQYQGARTQPDDSLLASLTAFRRAVELGPRNDEAWHQYGHALSFVSDSASLDAMRRALALDPARGITYSNLSFVYYLMGRNDRALWANDSAVALEPDGPFRRTGVLPRLTAGDTLGALAAARLVLASYWASSAVLAAFGHDSAAASALEARMPQASCDYGVAAYLLWTGRREQAVQQVLVCGASLLTRRWLRLPVFAPVADDPRIKALRAECDSILARARWR